jgi:hypothetical protein
MRNLKLGKIPDIGFIEMEDLSMKHNVGGYDRWIRIFGGMGILSFVFVPPSTNWAWLGLIPLLTGVFQICPIYALFGISSNKGVPTSEEVE